MATATGFELPPEAQVRLTRLRVLVDTLAQANALATNRIGEIERHINMNPQTPERPALELEIEELKRSRDGAWSRHRAAADLHNNVLTWLTRWKQDVRRDPVYADMRPRRLEVLKPSSAKPQKNETLFKGVERLRREMIELQRKIMRVQHAQPRPEDLKEHVGSLVERLGKQARPHIVLDKEGVLRVNDNSMVATMAGVFAALAWLFPEQVAQRFNEQIECLPTNPNAPRMSPDERQQRLDELDAKMFELEHIEDTWITMLHESGNSNIARRGNANPMIALGVKYAPPRAANGKRKSERVLLLPKHKARLDEIGGSDEDESNISVEKHPMDQQSGKLQKHMERNS